MSFNDLQLKTPMPSANVFSTTTNDSTTKQDQRDSPKQIETELIDSKSTVKIPLRKNYKKKLHFIRLFFAIINHNPFLPVRWYVYLLIEHTIVNTSELCKNLEKKSVSAILVRLKC
jgi:hypothetical protein